jgi:hypothetical protein
LPHRERVVPIVSAREATYRFSALLGIGEG